MTASPQLPPHYELIRLARVDSVMAETARRARDGAEEGTLVWADEQEDARTRSGHRWFSPPGNLHCAILLRPDFDNIRSGQLAYVAALSAGSALAPLLSPMTGMRYRWPDGIYINDLRSGRIVLASQGGGDPYPWLAVGAMVNVGLHPPNPEPDEYGSVHASGATEVTVPQLLEDYARYFLHWLNRWANEGFEPIGRQWQIRADGVGEEIALALGERRLRGNFVGLDDQGRLVIRSSGDADTSVSVNEYYELDRE